MGFQEIPTHRESKRKARATRAGGNLTREKILDAAEGLFADNSFDSVSLREIALQADAVLALASYHFGSKEALFEAVVARRADILRVMRMERLNALEESTTRELLDAFMSPLFAMAASGRPGWSAYLRVLARLGEQERWIALFSRHFDETARAFLSALQRALPGADADELERGFTMSLEAMLGAVAHSPARCQAERSGAKIQCFARSLSGAFAIRLRGSRKF